MGPPFIQNTDDYWSLAILELEARENKEKVKAFVEAKEVRADIIIAKMFIIYLFLGGWSLPIQVMPLS